MKCVCVMRIAALFLAKEFGFHPVPLLKQRLLIYKAKVNKVQKHGSLKKKKYEVSLF